MDPAPPDLIQQFLAERDEPCPGCGYNLRALTGDMCPECGHRVELCVEREKPGFPRIAVWMSGVSLVTSVGFTIWGIASLLQMSRPPGLPSGAFTRAIIVASAYLTAALAALIIALICWRRRGGKSARIALVMGGLTFWTAQLTYSLVNALGSVLGLW